MQYSILIACIVAPILAPAVLFALLSKGKMIDKVKSLVTLNSRESLIKQKIFWLSLIVPVCYFFVFGYICWLGYSIDLSLTGVENFLKISTLPLALLSAAVPLGVVVASFHSTQQTAEQIRVTLHKNNLDSYYAHRTDFYNHFSRHIEVNYLNVLPGKFKPHPLLYCNCVSGVPEDGAPTAHADFFQDLGNHLNTAANSLDAIFDASYTPGLFLEYMGVFCVDIHYVAAQLGLPEIYLDLASHSYQITLPPGKPYKSGAQFISLGTTDAEALAAFRYAWDFYISLCMYMGVYPTILPKDIDHVTNGGRTFVKPGYGNIKRIFREEVEKLRLDPEVRIIKGAEIVSNAERRGVPEP
ncbi:hypothetical protein [Pseudomonas protegens]|uniref:hypothetical protein n=1 Tax=Pseudomonas protegens TaxID=380021 RepID=UPI0027550D0F|nr:hypothetical protein [Pseudomonas protegens]MDP9525370.1 hypothetical protein [Pseudomonas protegens]